MKPSDFRPLIALLAKDGWTYQAIADLFGVSRQSIEQLTPSGVVRASVQRHGPRGPGRESRDRARIVYALAEVLDDWPIRRISKSLFPGHKAPPAKGRRLKRRIPRKDQVVTLWNYGLNYPQLRSLLGVTNNYIGSTLSYARLQGVQVRAGSRGRKAK